MFCVVLGGPGNARGQSLPAARLFIVNSTADSADAVLGDGICADVSGHCTLRSAIDEANTTSQSDVIAFALTYPATIDMTLGVLTISRPVSIVGPGARNLTVERSTLPSVPDARVFNFARNTQSYTASLSGMTIRNGVGSLGGGLHTDVSVTANLRDLAFIGNRASLGGAVGNEGTANITRCLLSANTGTNQGGAFENLTFGAVATITDSTITGNSAPRGGGIYNNGDLLLVNDTLDQNSAATEASGVDNALEPGNVVRVMNTIIGRDASQVGSLGGTITSLGTNIVTDARGGSGFANGVQNDQVSVSDQLDPGVLPLSGNGGDTDTQALSASSIAIDRGNPCARQGTCSFPGRATITLASDQRINSARVSGVAIDIGAFESGSASLVGTTGFRFQNSGGTVPASGALVELMNCRTGSLVWAKMNPFGWYAFHDVALGDDLVRVMITKRGFHSDPTVFSFPFTSP